MPTSSLSRLADQLDIGSGEGDVDDAGQVGTVAVVVDTVSADFFGPRVDRVVGVVAVIAHRNGIGGLGTGGLDCGRVAESVAVGIGPPLRGVDRVILVGGSVAVVVVAVTVLVGTRIGIGVAVVAVRAIEHVVDGGLAGGQAGGRVAEAVTVTVVEVLARQDLHGGEAAALHSVGVGDDESDFVVAHRKDLDAATVPAESGALLLKTPSRLLSHDTVRCRSRLRCRLRCRRTRWCRRR